MNIKAILKQAKALSKALRERDVAEALAANRWKMLKEASLWIYADDTARIVHKKRFNEFLVDLAEEMAEYVK